MPARFINSAPLSLFRLMYQARIAKAALKVALVVGTALNVINNGEQLWMHHTVNLWQLGMNFFIPYCVSSYSAARHELSGQAAADS